MRLFGLFGFPLSHSFSEKYFAKKFEKENITNVDYQLFPIENISVLPLFIKQHPDLQGFNITIPYKITILPYLYRITDEAASVGAVNCVKIERTGKDFKLIGYNTDIYGFRDSLIPALKPYQQNALILGTGGASKAVSYTLKQMGIKCTFVSRYEKDSQLHYLQLSEKLVNDNLLIINTTPLGMFPETENYPDIPYQFLGKRHLLVDLIYNPIETKFLKKGHDAGSATMNGLRMLELQAEKSWDIWNDR